MGYKKRRKDGAPKRNDDWSKNVDEASRTNEMFETYYRQLVPEAEWDEFMAALHTPLPTTFWINHCSAGVEVRRFMQEFAGAMQDMEIDGVRVEPPQPLPFYPDDMAWKVSHPPLTLNHILMGGMGGSRGMVSCCSLKPSGPVCKLLYTTVELSTQVCVGIRAVVQDVWQTIANR